MSLSSKTCLALVCLLFPLFLNAQVEVRVISGNEDLPEAFSAIWKKGDFLVADGNVLALVGGSSRPMKSMLNYPAPDAMGSILGLVPAGKGLVNDLNIGAPVLRIKGRTEYLAYASIKPLTARDTGKDVRLEASAVYAGKAGEKADVRTTYVFSPGTGRIELASVLTNSGPAAITDLGYSLYFGPNSSYSFSPYDKEKAPDLNFRVYQKKGLYVGWIDLNPVEEEETPLPGSLPPGGSFEVRYKLLVDARGRSLLERIFDILKKDTRPASFLFKDFPGGLMEIIVQDAFSSSVYFRSFMRDAASCEVPLPEGTYRVRANIFPAVSEKLFAVGRPNDGNVCVLENPRLGTIKVRIRDTQGAYVPGKVTFIGLDPTRTPYFEPDDPTETGRSYERFKNSRYPKQDGTEVRVTAGNYLIFASRGPESTMDLKVVEVLEDRVLELEFRVDKVVETRGFISLDPHLHTINSDSSVRIPERLRSIVAEGVDLALATDHNYVTDYLPTLKKLGLDRWLAVLPGEEVTPRDFYIHFNVYPFPYEENEANHGAVSPVADRVSALFQAARAKAPGALLQVNHPRSGDLGYFNNARLDRESAAFSAEDFDTGFDLLEVMNGPAFFAANDEAVEDWFHLLDRGFYYPITGSSDSHSADGQEPGYSRVYIRYEGEKGERLDWNTVAGALKRGRAFVTNGPFVEFTANGRYACGDTFTDKSGKVDLKVKVRSAPWVAVDEVRIIVNGERKFILPVKADERSVVKFSDGLSFTVDRDSTIAVEVLGKRSLFPVVQQAAASGTADDAALPYALTNPIFVDVDGNGRYDAPLPHVINGKPADEIEKAQTEK